MAVPRVPTVPACAIGQGDCFRKRTGTQVYLRISQSAVKFYGLDTDGVYGVCFNGNMARVDFGTPVVPMPFSTLQAAPTTDDLSVDPHWAAISRQSLARWLTDMNETEDFYPDWVSPPGDTIVDILEQRNWAPSELAERTRQSTSYIRSVIAGQAPITAELAAMLSEVLGSTTDFWLDREAQYRVALARQTAVAKVDEDTTAPPELDPGWVAGARRSIGNWLRGEARPMRAVTMDAHAVSAVVSGNKTQLRRTVRGQGTYLDEFNTPCPNIIVVDSPYEYTGVIGQVLREELVRPGKTQHEVVRCPYGEPGDRLWVREAWGFFDNMGSPRTGKARRGWDTIVYRAEATDALLAAIHWRRPSQMPKWAAGLWLEVLDVRVERLQDITEAGAIAEGMGSPITRDCKQPKFAVNWDRLNAKKRDYSWADDPLVWVVTFKRVDEV